MKWPLIFVAAVAVAGCTEQTAVPADQGEAAAGEVAGGTISDAMIPLEQLESQAPLAPRQAPAAGDVDSEQPDVTPAAGIDTGPISAGAEAVVAAPAPETPQP